MDLLAFIMLYKCLVRSHLVYAHSVWSPRKQYLMYTRIYGADDACSWLCKTLRRMRSCCCCRAGFIWTAQSIAHQLNMPLSSSQPSPKLTPGKPCCFCRDVIILDSCPMTWVELFCMLLHRADVHRLLLSCWWNTAAVYRHKMQSLVGRRCIGRCSMVNLLLPGFSLQ